MKFRMAQNSLFAVLLRSPWWISLLIVVVFVAAMHAVLPAEYRVLGSLGAFPFVVITGIAFWRQMRAPSAAEAQALVDAVMQMNWAQFDAALRQGFARQGWQVSSGKRAADLVLQRPGKTALVSARRWKAARHGEDALQPLQTAMREEQAHGVYIALGELSPQALKLAKAEGIELLERDALVQLLRGTVPRA